jgi:methyl-accepting chemotaxis protein
MLTKLVPDIQKTAELVQEISTASAEQSTGAAQINKAIQQLDLVTQQNASAAEEMSATSEELAAQAEQLKTAIAFFKLARSAAQRVKPAAPVHAAGPKKKTDRPAPKPAPSTAVTPTGAIVLLEDRAPAKSDDAEFEKY